jgi:hypothetical protein
MLPKTEAWHPKLRRLAKSRPREVFRQALTGETPHASEDGSMAHKALFLQLNTAFPIGRSINLVSMAGPRFAGAFDYETIRSDPKRRGPYFAGFGPRFVGSGRGWRRWSTFQSRIPMSYPRSG